MIRWEKGSVKLQLKTGWQIGIRIFIVPEQRIAIAVGTIVHNGTVCNLAIDNVICHIGEEAFRNRLVIVVEYDLPRDRLAIDR